MEIKFVKLQKHERQKTIMITNNKFTEEKNKILKGLELVYDKLIAFKKSKNSELVVLRDNKIIKIKP